MYGKPNLSNNKIIYVIVHVDSNFAIISQFKVVEFDKVLKFQKSTRVMAQKPRKTMLSKKNKEKRSKFLLLNLFFVTFVSSIFFFNFYSNKNQYNYFPYN